MAVERTLQVGTLVTDLLQVLLGPLVFWFVLLHFGKPLKQFVSNLGEFTFKAAGVEASAKKRRQIEAATLLGAATARQETVCGTEERSPGESTPPR